MMWRKIMETNTRVFTILESKNHIIDNGKYIGLTIEGLHMKDPGYLYWLSNSKYGALSQAAKEYMDWIDGQ